MMKNDLEDRLALALEERDFETILEDFDLTPNDVFYILYQGGMLDEQVLENLV